MTAIAEGLTLDDTALAELQAGFRGEIVGRDDPSYDEHRKVWNGSIDRRPGLIARCSSADRLSHSGVPGTGVSPWWISSMYFTAPPFGMFAS